MGGQDSVVSENLRETFGKDILAKRETSQMWSERAPLDFFFSICIKYDKVEIELLSRFKIQHLSCLMTRALAKKLEGI